ncbi:MAG: SLC13 family permease [Planctomycetota bacterium]
MVILGFVYLGMVLGEIPGLAIDRTGMALLGAIGLLATGKVCPQDAWDAIDVPTIALLLGLMVVSAQFRLGGMYSAVTHRIAAARLAPDVLLLLLIAVAAALSAVLANDIVCLAVAPLLVEGCLRRGLKPQPFLLALACASNVGSAATLIGNPQNMLIGQKLHLSFAGYPLDGGVPIGWKDHARVGLPVTLTTLAIAGGWLWVRAVLG